MDYCRSLATGRRNVEVFWPELSPLLLRRGWAEETRAHRWFGWVLDPICQGHLFFQKDTYDRAASSERAAFSSPQDAAAARADDGADRFEVTLQRDLQRGEGEVPGSEGRGAVAGCEIRPTHHPRNPGMTRFPCK